MGWQVTQLIYAMLDGHKFGNTSVTMMPYGTTTRNIVAQPSSISGDLEFPSGEPAPGVELSLKDKTSGKSYEVITGADGSFSFNKLLPGEYSLGPSDGNLSIGTQEFTLSFGQNINDVSLTLHDATHVSGSVTIGGQGADDVSVGFLSEQREIWVTTENGEYNATLPQGTTVYVLTAQGGPTMSPWSGWPTRPDGARPAAGKAAGLGKSTPTRRSAAPPYLHGR